MASQVQAIQTLPEIQEPTHAPPTLVEGLPPLMCGEELCDRPLRMFDRDGRPAHMEYGWWQAYGPDLDWNGMDDRLQRVMSGLDSMSPTAIIGPDGRKTVAIVVDYAWNPTDVEEDNLRSTLESHGWVGQEQGAFFETIRSIDAIAVDKVPVSALMDIYHLNGVVVIEMQNVMVPSNDVASRAATARPSADYSFSTHEQGYYGTGVTIAVLDTGVDNEHRSLNDFDDVMTLQTPIRIPIPIENGLLGTMQQRRRLMNQETLTLMMVTVTVPTLLVLHSVRVMPQGFTWGLHRARAHRYQGPDRRWWDELTVQPSWAPVDDQQRQH